MKKLMLFLCFCLFPFGIYGQVSYFIANDNCSYGVNIVDNGDLLNAQFCSIKNINETKQYTAYEVSEYKFEDGRTYFSKTILINDSLKKVFMLRLVKGKLSLYYYKGKGTESFYLEEDSTRFYELPKYNQDHSEISFRNNLAELTADCMNVKSATAHVNYNKKSLAKLINNYNDCVLKPFPYFRYGLLAGASMHRLECATFNFDSNSNITFNYETGFFAGVFVDCPIDMSDFSIHSDLYFTKRGYSYNFDITDIHTNPRNIAFVANTSTINLPILLRYTYPSLNYRPFLNVGMIYSYNLQNSTSIYRSNIYPTYIETIGVDETSHISKNEYGFAAGAGLEYTINNKHTVFIELRYNKMYSIPEDSNFKRSEFQLSLGVNL